MLHTKLYTSFSYWVGVVRVQRYVYGGEHISRRSCSLKVPTLVHDFYDFRVVRGMIRPQSSRIDGLLFYKGVHT